MKNISAKRKKVVKIEKNKKKEDGEMQVTENGRDTSLTRTEILSQKGSLHYFLHLESFTQSLHIRKQFKRLFTWNS